MPQEEGEEETSNVTAERERLSEEKERVALGTAAWSKHRNERY